MTIRRIFIAMLIAIIIAPTIVIAWFVTEFDPNRYAPALIRAVEKATGRQLTLGGPIRMSLSLSPEISADNLSLANPKGFPDSNLITVNRLQAKISLLPLFVHRINIVKLVALNPEVILETTNTGAADWDLTPPSVASRAVAGASLADHHSSNFKISLEAVEIQDGSIIIRTANSSNSVTIALASVSGTAASPSSPLNLTAHASFEGVNTLLNGVVGPVIRFSGSGSGPWPVHLALSARGALATVDGTLREPRNMSGYDLSVALTIPRLETLADGLPSRIINQKDFPPIHGIVVSAEVVGQDAPIPAINHLIITAAASDLSRFRPGLMLTNITINAPSLSSPVSVSAKGGIGTTPISVDGSFGAPSNFINPAWLPPVVSSEPPNFSVSVASQVGNNQFSIVGGIASPITLAGTALNVKTSIRDLSSLGPLAGAPLPGWKNIIAQGTLIDPGGLGLMNAIGIDSLILSMDNAELGGDLSWYFGKRPRLQIALKAQQINVDPLIAALPAAPASLAPAPASPPAQQETNYLLGSSELPLALLQNASADVEFSADSLSFLHATYTAIQAHAVVANGVLTISPVTAIIPGGNLAVSAAVDASKNPAEAALSTYAPALAVSPLLNAVGLPSAAEGTLQAEMSVSGTGDSLQELASSVQGQLGVAMVNGTVDGEVLRHLFGAVLNAVDLPASLVGAQGAVAVRCFGLRVDAENGIGRVAALTLDSSRLLLQGGGTLNFGNETLGLILRPQVRLAGTEIGVPVMIGGTFADPTTSVAPLAAVQEAAKSAVGLSMSLTEEVSSASSLLDKIKNTISRASTSDACPAALTLARLGKTGPAAPPVSATTSAGASGAAPNIGPKSLLNALFGK